MDLDPSTAPTSTALPTMTVPTAQGLIVPASDTGIVKTGDPIPFRSSSTPISPGGRERTGQLDASLSADQDASTGSSSAPSSTSGTAGKGQLTAIVAGIAATFRRLITVGRIASIAPILPVHADGPGDAHRIGGEQMHRTTSSTSGSTRQADIVSSTTTTGTRTSRARKDGVGNGIAVRSARTSTGPPAPLNDLKSRGNGDSRIHDRIGPITTGPTSIPETSITSSCTGSPTSTASDHPSLIVRGLAILFRARSFASVRPSEASTRTVAHLAGPTAFDREPSGIVLVAAGMERRRIAGYGTHQDPRTPSGPARIAGIIPVDRPFDDDGIRVDLQTATAIAGIAFQEDGGVGLDVKGPIDVMDPSHDIGGVMDLIARMIGRIALRTGPRDPDQEKGQEEEGAEKHSGQRFSVHKGPKCQGKKGPVRSLGRAPISPLFLQRHSDLPKPPSDPPFRNRSLSIGIELTDPIMELRFDVQILLPVAFQA